MFAQISQTQQQSQQQPQQLFSLPNASNSFQQPVGQIQQSTTQKGQTGLNIQTPQQPSLLFQTGQNATPNFLSDIKKNNQQNKPGQNTWTCAPPVQNEKLDTLQQKIGLFQVNQNTTSNQLNDQNKNIQQGQVLSNQQPSVFNNFQGIFNQQSLASNSHQGLFAPKQDSQNILNAQNSHLLIDRNSLPQQLQQENQILKEKIQQMDQRICELERLVESYADQDQKIVQLENNFKILAQFCQQNFKGLCNNGHILEHFTSLLAQYLNCDVCQQSLTDTGLGSYRCQVCDFDRCDKCYNQNRLI
ncbi:hypothetical protein ABPG72_021469 [Tetrahymena utriculariae]